MSALLERVLLKALRAEDPVRAIQRASRNRRLTADERARLQRVDGDGVRLAALLVARLRFERLLRGSPKAEAWFDRDPPSFAEAFRAYHAAVPPTAFFPRAEAALFSRYVRRTNKPIP